MTQSADRPRGRRRRHHREPCRDRFARRHRPNRSSTRSAHRVPIQAPVPPAEQPSQRPQRRQPAPAAPQPAPARRRILLPTKGHVDLAVSAAAELARLTSEQLHGRRIAVHVVVTSDDGRSVEADAIIEESIVSRRKKTAAARPTERSARPVAARAGRARRRLDERRGARPVGPDRCRPRPRPRRGPSAVAVVLWILLGSIDRVLARASPPGTPTSSDVDHRRPHRRRHRRHHRRHPVGTPDRRPDDGQGQADDQRRKSSSDIGMILAATCRAAW